jgi:hypothetical protein
MEEKVGQTGALTGGAGSDSGLILVGVNSLRDDCIDSMVWDFTDELCQAHGADIGFSIDKPARRASARGRSTLS